MPNPKAPRVHRSSNESVGGVDLMSQRLATLGATPEEIRGMRENWTVDSEDWTEEDRATLLRTSDGDLRRMLKELRDEYPYEPSHEREPLEMNEGGVVVGVDDFQTPDQRRAQAAAEQRAVEGAQAHVEDATTPAGPGVPDAEPAPAATPDVEPAPAGTPDAQPGPGSTPETPEPAATPDAAPAFDITDSVPKLTEWVAGNAERARLVLEAEHGQPEGERRKTLIEGMNRVLADGAE